MAVRSTHRVAGAGLRRGAGSMLMPTCLSTPSRSAGLL
jgi:hypothetical protein